LPGFDVTEYTLANNRTVDGRHLTGSDISNNWMKGKVNQLIVNEQQCSWIKGLIYMYSEQIYPKKINSLTLFFRLFFN